LETPIPGSGIKGCENMWERDIILLSG